MLPSSGYFRGIPCPAHARGSCGRPYCHFHHDVKERNVSPSASSSQAVTPAPAQEEADAEEGNRQGTFQDQDMRGTLQDQDMRGTLQDQDMRQGLPGCSTATLSVAPVSSPEPERQEEEEEQQQKQRPQQQEQQESEPHTSQPAMAAGNIPKPDLLHQLMNEALKKVLAENPALASTVDASAIRIGIDPVGQASPDGSKTKKSFYPRPPDTPSYNPTPIKELKKRKVSVDGGSSLGYTPTGTTLAGPTDKRNEEEEDGGVMGEFSSSDSEEVEKNADFDLLEEVLAEHSKNNKVKVKKKRVKELGKLQYSLINADKRKVDNNVLIADAKKLTDKEVKRYEVSQVENVNKVITDGPYFLPPSPIFTSSSDGFEAFNSRASYQDEEEEGQKEKSKPDKCTDKPLQQTELTKANSEPTSEKNTAPKQSQEPSTSSEKEQPKTSGHTHLPKLLPTLDAPKLSRPNVRSWIPLVRNPIPAPEAQKSSDQLDEMLKMMDGSDASNKRKSKESEHQTSSQKNSENARPRKKYKVDLNKEIESLTNPAVDQVKETVAPEEDSTDPQPGTSNNQDGDKKQDTKEEDEAEESQAESKEKRTAKKTSRKNSEDKKKRNESESENSNEDSHTEESEDSRNRRGKHKKKRKRSRSSSSDSGYSRHRKKKRKRSHRRHRKRSKKYRKRRDSMSSLSDQSKDSEDQEDEEEEEEEGDEDVNDDGQEEKEVDDDDDDDDDDEEKDDKEGENENKSNEDSESDNNDDSNDEVDHRKKSRRHRKKHKHYRKSKRRKNKRKAKRKRKRSKSYSRSRSSSGSRDSSRSRSRSRSSSKHRKKKSRSRHRSRNESDSEERDSDRVRSRSRSSSRQSSKRRKSRSRSSSRHSSKRRKSRESREKDSGSSKLKESSKSKDGRLEEEGRKATKGGDRSSRDRSSSKSRQQGTNESSKKHSQEETPIPLPVDPSKIKVEKNASEALIPDLSKVKVEKEEESSSEKSNTQVNTSVHTKGNDKSHEEKHKGQSESRHSKTSEKIHGRRRSSTEEKSKRRLSHDRKDSTESMSDKGTQRRQSCESKTSDAEASQQRKKPEERRLSSDKNKMTPSISSQPSEMSMFDLVLASTKKPKPKTLTEISIFDSICNTDTNDGEQASDRKVAPSDAKKSKDTSHKSSGESGNKSSASHTTDHKSGSSSRAHKSSRSDKDAHTDSHHKHDKNDNKPSHSSSKSKSSSSSSSHHHSSNNSSSSSSHRKSSSSSSSKGSSSKHHNASATSASTTSTTSATSFSSSSKHSETNSSSSRNKKASESGSSKSEKDSSRHSSTSNRKHSNSTSSSSSKHQNSTSSSSNRKSSSSSKHKENKGSVAGSSKLSEGSESAKKRKVSEEEDSPGGVSDNDHFSSGGDSPMPDLSVLDEIPQDDWEQILSGSDAFNIQEPLEESDGDDTDHDDPGVMEECMKMFNEFQQDNNPLENQVLPKKIKTQPEDSKEPASALSKQRVARSSSSGNLIIKKPTASRHQKNNPMQRMVERYQKLKEELKLKEQQLHHLQGGSSAVSSSSTSRTSIAAASSSTHHSVTSPSISGKTKKRIAHVPNVSSLLNSQGKIRNHSSSSSKNKISPKVATASGVIPETTAHTVAKGGKRVAHVPRPGSLARPIIQPEHGSLVPQNIRQRYLNALIEECKKFCTEREAFNIAAAEERVCYQRAPSRMVYLNLVVNAVKRLRTQQQAGEGAQELLDRDPQLAEKMCVEEPSSSSSKPSTSPSPSSSPSSSRSHPVNPNHVQLSHTTVLSSGGFKGSWSIEKSKKNANSSDGALKGETFYKHLLKYVLTEEQLEENGYPCPDPEEKGKAVVKKIDTRKKISPSALERYCDRCSALYNVDKWGFPKTSAPCVHHWGRPYKKRKYGTFETTYSCCGGEQGSAGCSQATTHVSQNYNPKNLRGYVRTISKDMSSSNKEVYALDCEMCYTTEGNELTRVTVIGWDGNVVYEQLVKPDNPILDYNTRFSGITESDMEDVKITIRDVQAALLARFSDKTILIGHSLESDLHALKVIHNTVVDTSVVFPHKMGAPYKRALKNLAAEHLKRIIQDDVSGHDSAEDAIACLHLMQWKVKEDLKGFSK